MLTGAFNLTGQTKNSIAMFFAGVAITLGTVLLAVFVIKTCRRNCQTSKLSTSADAIHTAVELQTDPAIELPAFVTSTEPTTEPTQKNCQVSVQVCAFYVTQFGS